MSNFVENKQTYSSWLTIKKVAPYLWPDQQSWVKRRVILALMFLMLAKIVAVSTPFLFKAVVDGLASNGKSTDALMLLLGASGIVFAYGFFRLASVGFGELRDVIFAKVAQRALRSLALETFEHIHALSLRYHISRKTGGLSRVIERGVKGVDFLLRFMLFSIIPLIIELTLVAIILFLVFDIWYLVVVVTTITLYIWFTFTVAEWRVKIRKEMNKQDTEANQKAIDSLLNFETVKYFNAEIMEADRFNKAMRTYEDSAVKARASLSIVNIGQGGVIALGLFLVMGMAGEDIAKGNMSVGDFVVVNTFLLQLYLPLNFLGFVYREIRQSLLDMGRMFALVDEKPEIIDQENAYELKVKNGKIEFIDVNFSFGKRKILKNLTFTIESGEKVAIVGPTGAGKSTISKLLFRFYDPSAGNIYIDGQCIADVTQNSLRSNIGVVPQDTVLFNDSIKYNIAYSKPNSSMNEIVNAAKLSSIDKFISNLEAGYETLVGERGLKLSGGEKQRIAIARAILKNPQIFVFDEATSALDTKTEKSIEKSLKKLSSKNTTLIIAHRLSTIIDADKIIVLDNGAIIEIGSHQELINKNGLYAEMWIRQQENLN